MGTRCLPTVRWVPQGRQTPSHAHLAEAKFLQVSTLNSALPRGCCTAGLNLAGLRGASCHGLSV